ncbi:DHA2 family efflux MFS transporter permease subunit [Planotetraspora phitsanulokensis]|uniref:MFS transporter n=1 Tax=Planotetraspora phitsanulokensis TaxID=575192 RepID=A0A8J3XHF9_9ACTN|nr:MFS transporter [Planotetraspora phitsanulokensis]GII36528.1 MFS transporter [Planotetraspora phitsanulokensis]
MAATSPLSASNDQDHTESPDVRRWWLLGLLSVAQFMLVLDVTVVNVALPDIGVELALHRGVMPWVLTTYTLVFGGLMLLGGRATDMFGARRVLLSGLAIFVVASLVSGLAADAAILLAGRAAQGIGAALMSPAALSMVTTTFAGKDRARALGIWAAIGGAGSALGVILGGLLTSGPGWRWVFFINVPAGLIVLALTPLVIPARWRRRSGPVQVDAAGALSVTLATGAAIYGLVNVGGHGWLAVSTLVPLAVAVLLYGVFVLVERVAFAPLMPLRVLTGRPVVAGVMLMLVATGLLVGAFYLGSFYLQRLHGYSAAETGLAFLPIALGTIIGAHGGSQAVTKLDGRVLAAGSLAVAALGSGLAAAAGSPLGLVAGLSVASIGVGAALVTAVTAALSGVAPDEAGTRSGIVNTFHELGGALGVAVLSSVAVGGVTGDISTSGVTHAFTVSAVAAVAAAVLAAIIVPAGVAPAGAIPHTH